MGLIIGFVLVEIFLKIMWVVAGDGDKDERDDIVRKVKGMYSVPKEVDESDESDESDKKDETFFDTHSFLHDHEDQSILPQDRDSS